MDVETNDRVCSFFTSKPYTGKKMWPNILLFGYCHLMALAGVYLLITKASLCTWVFCIFMCNVWGIGITVGGHRLWAHRSFKANLPLRILLMLMSASALQRDMITWSRWHRSHHRWTDTDADPHNIKRGFFFAHIGWLLERPQPEHVEKSRLVDTSDLKTDPVLQFQAKYYWLLAQFLNPILPTVIAIYCWGEGPLTALTAQSATWIYFMHVTFCINSVTHVFGEKPYNARISAADNIFLKLMGEGHHNFHHVFPMDYRGSEIGVWFSPPTLFIDFFAYIGWASELIYVPNSIVEKKKLQNHANFNEQQ